MDLTGTAMTTRQHNCLHFPGSSKNKHSRMCLSGASPLSFVLLFARLFLGFSHRKFIEILGWWGGVGWGWGHFLHGRCGVVVWICAGNRGHNAGIFLWLLSRVWGCGNSLGSFSSAQSPFEKNLLLISNLTLPDTTGDTLQIPSPGQLYFLCRKKKNRDRKPHFH